MRKQKQISVREMDRRVLQSGRIRKYYKRTTRARKCFALALLSAFATAPLFLLIIL